MENKTMKPCPICSDFQPEGTFKTHPMEKPPFKKFRVERDGERKIIVGDFDCLEMARACACGKKNGTKILTREE